MIQFRREQCDLDIIDDIFNSMRGNITDCLEKKNLK